MEATIIYWGSYREESALCQLYADSKLLAKYCMRSTCMPGDLNLFRV